MVKKTASDLKTKIYNESLPKEKKKYIYWKKKEKTNLVIPIEKNRKSRNWLGKRKTTFRAAKLQCKKCSILSRAK